MVINKELGWLDETREEDSLREYETALGVDLIMTVMWHDKTIIQHDYLN